MKFQTVQLDSPPGGLQPRLRHRPGFARPRRVWRSLALGLAFAAFTLGAACPGAPPAPARRAPPTTAARSDAPRPRAVAFADARRYVLRPAGLGGPRTVALSADGRLLALATRFGGVHLVTLATGKSQALAAAEEELDSAVLLAFTPDGRHLVAAGFDDRELRIWDTATGKLARETALALSANGLAVGKGVAVVALSSRAELRAVPGGALLRRVPMPFDLPANHVATSPDGRRVAICSAAGHLQIFDLARGYAVSSRQVSESVVTALAFPPDGAGLLVGLENGRVRRLDGALQPLRDFESLDLGEAIVGLAAPAGNGPWLALRASGELLLFDAEKGTVLGQRAHGRPLASFAADARGGLVTAVETGRAAFLLQRPAAGAPLPLPRTLPPPPPTPRATLRLGKPIYRPMPEATRPIGSWAMGATGSPVVLGLTPPAAQAWTWQRGGKPRWTMSWNRLLPGPLTNTNRRVRIALGPKTPTGHTAYLHGPSDQIRRYRVVGGFPMAMLPTRAKGLVSLLPTPDGKLLVTTTNGATVHLWNVLGVPRGKFEGLERPYWVAISPDSGLLAEVAGVDDLAVFSLPKGEHLWSRNHRPHRLREVLGIRFDPGSRTLQSVHRTGFLRVHDARTGKRLALHRLSLPRGVSSCDLRPDLKVLACAAAERVHLYELPSGASLGALDLPKQAGAGALWGASFTDDGKGLMIQRGPRHLLLARFH